MVEWTFREMALGELNVDPIQSEFFTTEAIDGLTEALVRESIQNTLDAKKPGETAMVRFWLSGAERALPEKNIYINGLEKHLHAKGSGLDNPPGFVGGVPFLLIEDFGTRGLCGDPAQYKDAPGKNDFYYFWRNIGRSGKQENERGRWGLGKNVFPASSKVNTFFGFTQRDEHLPTLLMGQSVLKVHEVKDTRMYPYGYYANTDPNTQFAMPINDDAALNQFKNDFNLYRTTESGLSIVVLIPDDEINEEGILKATLRQYFYPIMTGLLSLIVPRAGGEIMVDKDSLTQTVSEMDADFKAELEPMMQIAEWAIKAEAVVVVKSPGDGSPKWETDAIAEGTLQQLRPEFEKGVRLAFEVPVIIRPNGKPEQSSKLRVFLERDLTVQSHRPMFVREGLIISDAVRTKQRGVRALVVADDKPLANLLGDAENPAHTEWQSQSAHFKNRYKFGPGTLKYVKDSVAAIVQMLTQSASEQDMTALSDFFFLVEPPTPEDQQKAPTPKPDDGPDPPPPPPPPPPPKPALVRIKQTKGGFTVTAAAAVSSAQIVAAYEVRRGNPFKRYHQADFEFGKQPIEVAAVDTTVIEQKLNVLTVGPLPKGATLTVTGFDQARDLAVRVSVEE